MTRTSPLPPRWRHAAAALVVALAAAVAAMAFPNDPQGAAVTAGDPGVPVETLRLALAPLTKVELEDEAEAWMALLRRKAGEIAAAEIALRDQRERAAGAAGAEETADSAEAAAGARAELLERLALLRGERAGLADRAEAVLDALQEKGGDTAEHRTYLAAVSELRVDVTDTGAAWATLVGWLRSPEGGIRWGVNVAKFLVIVAAFWLLATILGKAVDRGLRATKRLTSLLRRFLGTTVRRATLAVGIVVGLSALEVDIGPLLAVIGAAGFVVAFALQNTLSNFASGIMILLYRPFDVGDVVDVAGVAGTVVSLNLVSTTINTPDNKVVVVPNNSIWGSIITNVTGSTQRRVDMTFGIGYDADMDEARTIIEAILRGHPLVLRDPEPVVRVHELADSSVNLICRPWVRTADYWTVFWDVTRQVKEQFDRHGIPIPFPQRDVHLHYAAAPPLGSTIGAGRE